MILAVKKRYFLFLLLLVGFSGCSEKRRSQDFRKFRGIQRLDNQGNYSNPVRGSSAGKFFRFSSLPHQEDIKLFLSYAYDVPQDSVISDVALVGDIYPLNGSQFSLDSWFEVVVEDNLSHEYGAFQVGFSPQRSGASIRGSVSNNHFNVEFQDPSMGSMNLNGQIIVSTGTNRTIQGQVVFTPIQRYDFFSNRRIVLGNFVGVNYCWLFRC